MNILNNFQIFLVFMVFFGMVSIAAGCSSSNYVNESTKYTAGDNDDKLLNDFTISTSPGQTLRVYSDAGSVKIKVGSSDNTVKVKVYGDDATNSRVDYKAEQTTDGVEVTARFNDEYKKDDDWTFRLRFEIEVPSSYNIKVKTGGGSVSVGNTNGDVNVSTGGGSISVSNTIGDLKINTGGGSVKISNNSGNLDINTGGGVVKPIMELSMLRLISA